MQKRCIHIIGYTDHAMKNEIEKHPQQTKKIKNHIVEVQPPINNVITKDIVPPEVSDIQLFVSPLHVKHYLAVGINTLNKLRSKTPVSYKYLVSMG